MLHILRTFLEGMNGRLKVFFGCSFVVGSCSEPIKSTSSAHGAHGGRTSAAKRGGRRVHRCLRCFSLVCLGVTSMQKRSYLFFFSYYVSYSYEVFTFLMHLKEIQVKELRVQMGAKST